MGSAMMKGLHRAELAGQQAARDGRPESDCPYKSRRGGSGCYRDAWLRGWAEERLVWLYRLEGGRLTAISVRRADVKYMETSEWAATASREGDVIAVTVIHGDPDRRGGQWLLTDLVRGDLQD